MKRMMGGELQILVSVRGLAIDVQLDGAVWFPDHLSVHRKAMPPSASSSKYTCVKMCWRLEAT